MSSKRALVCSHYPPEFDRDGGSRRMLGLLELLRADDWTLTFVASRAMSDARYACALQQLGIAVYDGTKTRFEDLVKAAQFNLALFAFWRVAEVYLPIMRRVSPPTRILVDSVDLHFVRNARRLFAGAAEPGAAGMLDSVYGAELVRELNVYAAADAVLTVSQKEADLLHDLIPEPGLARPVPDIENMPESTVPIAERRGIVFIGSFRHGPNIGAVEFLCKEVVPHLNPALTARHPIYIIGEKLDETVRCFGEGLPQVQMVGWVPSVQPYLERARVSVIPVRYGAGTKHKLLQTLMTGTPAVATSIGAEGFGLRHGKQVLIADDPIQFAAAIKRLLNDDALWQRLSQQGRAAALAAHGRKAGQARLQKVIDAVLAAAPKPASKPRPAALPKSPPMDPQQYYRLRSEIRQLVQSCVPPEAKVVVVSRGDSELLKLNGRTAWHFPQSADGHYAGYHPADSAEAISQLEALRAKGGRYVVLPSTMLWWLDHYPEFAQYLVSHGRLLYHGQEFCSVYELLEAGNPKPSEPGSTSAVSDTAPVKWTQSQIEALRPQVLTPASIPVGASHPTVLVLGIYLAAQPNTVEDIIAVLDRTHHCQVKQKWLALGGDPPSARAAEVTVSLIRNQVPKFALLNRLLTQEDISRYDYIVAIDDDVVLPGDFLHAYLSLQSHLGFAIAQPARTPNSYIDHPIVEQQIGVVARQTLFVEIGPVVSFHRSVFTHLFPFDLCSPMGWGYSNAWAVLARKCGFKLGVIDAVPVDHSLRPTLAHYDRKTAENQRAEFFKKHESLPTEQCYRVLDVVICGQQSLQNQPSRTPVAQPRISVIIPTHNRGELLSGSLESLVGQTIGASCFEVILVDDGSTDATRDVCRAFASRLTLRYYRIQHSGIAAAKNLGIFLAHAPLVLYFDDDDVADQDLLVQHVRTHEEHSPENRAVLGYTTWSPRIQVTPVMEYVTDIGQVLFAYKKLEHGQLLDFSYMWGGRSSCKKSLLLQHGIHDQRFLNMQDVELGYRLSKFGLKVVFNRKAVSYMARAITFDEFCGRCVRQGRSQYLLSRIHPDAVIQAYCKLVPNAAKVWLEMKPQLEAKVARVHELEAAINAARAKGNVPVALSELRSLYEWTFRALKIKGIVEAMQTDKESCVPVHPEEDSRRTPENRSAELQMA